MLRRHACRLLAVSVQHLSELSWLGQEAAKDAVACIGSASAGDAPHAELSTASPSLLHPARSPPTHFQLTINSLSTHFQLTLDSHPTHIPSQTPTHFQLTPPTHAQLLPPRRRRGDRLLRGGARRPNRAPLQVAREHPARARRARDAGCAALLQGVARARDACARTPERRLARRRRRCGRARRPPRAARASRGDAAAPRLRRRRLRPRIHRRSIRRVRRRGGAVGRSGRHGGGDDTLKEETLARHAQRGALGPRACALEVRRLLGPR